MGMVIILQRASASDIERLIADPVAFEEGDQNADSVDFDKAWHALHFMLSGSAGSADNALDIIAGDGDTYGADEDGFGGFTVITPEQMAAFHEGLNAISDAELASRYDIDGMMAQDIYLADAFANDGREEALEYILQSLPDLRRFAAECVRAGDGALRIIA